MTADRKLLLFAATAKRLFKLEGSVAYNSSVDRDVDFIGADQDRELPGALSRGLLDCPRRF